MFSVPIRPVFGRTLNFTSLLLTLVLVSCQSLSSIDDLGLNKLGASDATQTKNVEGGSSNLMGKGATRIAVLSSPNDKSVRQGAQLALQDLGKNILQLEFISTNASTGNTKNLLDSLNAKATRMLILSNGQTKIAPVKSYAFPVIALTEKGEGQIYGFSPNLSQSLVAGVRYASNAKDGVVLFSPRSVKAKIQQTLKNNAVKLTGTIVYGASETAPAIVNKNRSLLSKATILVFAGTDTLIPKLAAAARKLSSRKNGPILVGHDHWPTKLRSHPDLEGSIIASLDASDRALVVPRYQKIYGTAMTYNAMMAYDLVAVAAGISSTKGNKLDKKSIQVAAGFRGATGKFRFRTNASVERLYQISRISNGRLKVVAKSAAGF